MDHNSWVTSALNTLAAAGPEGQAAARYILKRGVQIRFRRQSRTTSAMWHLDGNIYFNPEKYSWMSSPEDAYLVSLIAHEAVHLRQGVLVALSRYGELEAWQAGFRILKLLAPERVSPVMNEILALPLGWDRKVIGRAVELMLEYAPAYRIRWLPVYPLPRELRFWLTRGKR